MGFRRGTLPVTDHPISRSHKLSHTSLPMKNLILVATTVVATLAFPSLSHAQTSYHRIGSTIVTNDGRAFNQIGNSVYGSDGSSYNRIGNTTITNDGRSYQQIGNTTVGSDGSTAHRIGDTTIINGPRGTTTCHTIGSTVVCN